MNLKNTNIEAPYQKVWISVKDRLPEFGDTVIVSGGIAYFSRDGSWYTITACDYPGSRIKWEVTHWMPLPTLNP